MFSWLCIFRPHRWFLVVSVKRFNEVQYALTHHIDEDPVGIWQCSRCKEISKGSWQERE